MLIAVAPIILIFIYDPSPPPLLLQLLHPIAQTQTILVLAIITVAIVAIVAVVVVVAAAAPVMVAQA